MCAIFYDLYKKIFIHFVYLEKLCSIKCIKLYSLYTS